MYILRLFREFLCANLVFHNYLCLGYYRWYGYFTAISAFFVEKIRLHSTILMVTKHGVPIGTIMCSVDNGHLPVDRIFPDAMHELRKKYEPGRIGYFGKYAVAPYAHGGEIGMTLIGYAINWWSLKNGIYAAVMMVHPKHVRRYVRFGARELGCVTKVTGMEKAPAVLLILDYGDYIQIRQKRIERILANKKSVSHVASVALPAT